MKSLLVYLLAAGFCTGAVAHPSGSLQPAPIRLLVASTNTTDDADGTFTPITGLSFTAEANHSYRFSCLILVSAANALTGVEWRVTGPTTPTRIVLNRVAHKDFSGTPTFASGFAFDNVLAPADSELNPVPYLLEGVLINGANAGTVQQEIDPETTTVSTVTAHAGSSCEVQEF